MEGKEAIINKILEDANAQASAIIEAAEAKASDIKSEAEKKLDDANCVAVSSAKIEGEELIKRRLTVADLEVKKKKLSAKKQLIDTAFVKAKDELLNLPSAKYKAMIEGMLKKHAEDGDTVIISQRDEKTVTATLIASVAKAKNIKLTLSEKFGDFDGGIILTSKGMDKNLTLDVELKLLKEELETEASDMIFGKE
jgi:V/A-type H+-transporting ATPase subunit E